MSKHTAHRSGIALEVTLPLDPSEAQAEIALAAELLASAEALTAGKLPPPGARALAALALARLCAATRATWDRKPDNTVAAELALDKRRRGTRKDLVAVRESIEALGLSITPRRIAAVQRALDRLRARIRA